MSAHKRALITPDSAALRRLDELSNQLRATSRPDPDLLKSFKEETRDQIRFAAAHSQQRQEYLNSRLDEQLGKMGSRLSDVERNTGLALAEQSFQIQALAEKSAEQGDLASQTMALIEYQTEQFSHLLDHSYADFRSEIEHISHSLEGLARRDSQGRVLRESAHQAADQALWHAQQYYEALQSAYPRATDLVRVEALLTQAQSNFEAGFSEASLSTAQQADWQLKELHFKLEREANELNILHAAVVERIGQVKALFEANSSVNAIDMDGRSLDYPIDVDFWTGGDWSKQEELIGNIHDHFLRQDFEFSKEDFFSFLDEILPEVEASVPEMVAKARKNVLASQMRYNMAEAVLAALKVQGFVPERASYVDGDMRQAYQLTFQNLEGSQVIATLAPHTSGLEHLLDLYSLDQSKRTPHELRQRARELARSLCRVGLQVRSTQPLGVKENRADYRSSNLLTSEPVSRSNQVNIRFGPPKVANVQNQ